MLIGQPSGHGVKLIIACPETKNSHLSIVWRQYSQESRRKSTLFRFFFAFRKSNFQKL